MQYCELGTLSSKAEENGIVNAINANRLPRTVVRRVAEYWVHLKALNTDGFSRVSGSWITTSQQNLVLFTGKRNGEEPTTLGGQRVFAAIELDPQDRVGTLIKLCCDYQGNPAEWANHCTDSEDRFLKGKRVP
jgi:hypothetical protein